MLRFLIEGQNVKISELEHAVRMMVTRKRWFYLQLGSIDCF
jgi:hypothetical protein